MIFSATVFDSKVVYSENLILNVTCLYIVIFSDFERGSYNQILEFELCSFLIEI